MEKWYPRVLKVLVILTCAFVIALSHTIWKDVSESFDRGLWLQSTEQQLKNQNEEYYNSLYERYSRLHRDLNDYQYQANKRLESLESRVKHLEERFYNAPVSINQTQVNGDNNGRN